MPKGVPKGLPTRPVPYPRFDGTQPCLEIGFEAYFPSGDDAEASAQVKQTCVGCPMLDDCRAYAISYAVQGVWGGTTYAERREIRKRLGIAAIPITEVPVDGFGQLLAHLDDGARSASALAEMAGCSVKTVERHRRQRRAEREAA